MPNDWEVVSQTPAPAAPATGWEVASEAPAPSTPPTTASGPSTLSYFTEPAKGIGRAITNMVTGPLQMMQPRTPQEEEQGHILGAMGGIFGNAAQRALMFGTHAIGDVVGGLKASYEARQRAEAQGEGIPGQILAAGEQLPFVGPMVRYAERGGTKEFNPKSLGAAAEAATYAAVPAVAERLGTARALRSSMDDSLTRRLTSTTNQRIAELKEFPAKVGDIHQTVVDAEKAAHTDASGAFPDVKTPVKLGTKTEGTGVFDPNGQEITRTVDIEKSFREAQEMRSNLLKQITDEKVAVARGAAPRYDLARLTKRLSDLDERMNAAADADGKLGELRAARAQYAEYMNDFHNPGSPLQPLLRMRPDETSRIAGHFLNADKGARAIETLQGYGVDTSAIEDMLSRGSTPLKLDINESAKLRKVGEENYFKQRLAESIDQARFNRLPSGAQARLPVWSTRARWPGLLEFVPGSPRHATSLYLKRAMQKFNSSDVGIGPGEE